MISTALASLFDESDLRADSGLVIQEFHQWRNPDGTSGRFCAQTFNLVVVPQEMSRS